MMGVQAARRVSRPFQVSARGLLPRSRLTWPSSARRRRANSWSRPNGRFEAWYRDDASREKTKQFTLKRDAQAWLNAQIAALARDDYVDPKAGRVTFGAFAKDWLAAQTFDDSMREAVESRLRVHIGPTFDRLELRAIRPSTVQGWLRSRQEHCAPRYVRVMLANLSSILGAAVEDGLIARNPCASRAVSAPAVEARKIIPWPAPARRRGDRRSP